MWFSKRMQGTISVFLVLVLLPMFVLTAVLIDGTIIFGAKNTINDAGELAMGGALAHYDEDLLACYGLIAMDEKTDVGKKGKEYFESTLSPAALTSYFGFPLETGSFIKLDPKNTKLSTVDNTEIWQPYVMENQELEFMKYRAPAIILTSGMLEALSQFKDVAGQVKCIKKELEFEEKMSDIQDLMLQLYNKLKDEYNPKYPWSYKDADIKGGWQGELATKLDKLSGWYLKRHALDAHLAPGDASYDDSKSAAEACVEIAKYIDGSDGAFVKINEFRDAQIFVLDSDFTGELEEGDEGYDELKKLEDDYDAACTKADLAADAIYENTDSIEEETKKLATQYYEETLKLYDIIYFCEKKCQEIQDKVASSKGDFEEWGKAIDEVEDPDKRASMKKAYDEWEPLFHNLSSGDSSTSAASLEEMKNDLHDDRVYLEDMLKHMREMKFCGISYPASGINGNWGSINSYACGYTVKTLSDYNSAHADMMGTLEKTDFSSLSSTTLKEYYEDRCAFYREMKEFYCKPVGTEDKGKAKKQMGDMKSKIKEEKEPESSNARLKQSLSGKSIPSNVSKDGSFASVSTKEDENKKKLSEIDDPEAKKKDAKKSGVDMLNDKGGILESLSGGALDVVSGLFSKVYESAYEATYVTEMFSNATTGVKKDESGKASEDDTVSLKGMDMTQNYLYQGEAEYILWGDATPSNDVFYNKATIWTVRFALNVISGYLNGDLRAEALEVATLAGALFPLSIPLIQNCTILICCALETMIDRQYLIAKGEDIVLMHTKDTWFCYPMTFAVRNTDNRKDKKYGYCMGYKEYTWLFLFATMIGDGAGPNARLVRTADCIELNLHDVLKANSILKESTMVQMSSEVGIKTNFLQNAASFVGSGDISDDNFKINFNSAQGY